MLVKHFCEIAQNNPEILWKCKYKTEIYSTLELKKKLRKQLSGVGCFAGSINYWKEIVGR